MKRWYLRISPALLALLASASFAVQPPPASTALSETERNDCVALKDKFPAGVIVSAEPREPRTWGVAAADQGFLYTWKDLPGFCEVDAVVPARNNVRVKIWLPKSAIWNQHHRFLGTGNGGYGGSFKLDALAGGVSAGFAVANTDLGTVPATTSNADVLVGQPEVWADFGYRATHEMTVLAKKVIETYYSAAPGNSYFSGCSTGGQQGLAEAQRYPDDYQGILAGDPAYNRTRVHTELLWSYKQLEDIPEAKLIAIHDKLVNACNGHDGFMTNPAACDARSILNRFKCKPGENSTGSQECLTPQESAAFENLFFGLQRNGKTIALGVYPDADLQSIYGLVNQRNASEPMFDSIFRWVFGASWNWRQFHFDRDADVDTVNKTLAATLNVYPGETHYPGKLILYHGWADPLISWRESLQYYREHAAVSNENLRFYLAPGMAHCFQGAGPNSFGAPFQPPITDTAPDAATSDILYELVRWVENGDAPKEIHAVKNCQTSGPAADKDRSCKDHPDLHIRGSLCRVKFESGGGFSCEAER